MSEVHGNDVYLTENSLVLKKRVLSNFTLRNLSFKKCLVFQNNPIFIVTVEHKPQQASAQFRTVFG